MGGGEGSGGEERGGEGRRGEGRGGEGRRGEGLLKHSHVNRHTGKVWNCTGHLQDAVCSPLLCTNVCTYIRTYVRVCRSSVHQI